MKVRCCLLFILFTATAYAQQATEYDTLVNTTLYTVSGKKVNPFLPFAGKTIRHIYIKPIGFESAVNDTNSLRKGIGIAAANNLHKNTRIKVIQNNLLFKQGDRLNPYLLSDNERYLRDLNFIQDALFIIQKIPGSPNEVNIVVVIKDVFSLGPGAGIGGTQKFNLELKDENVGGSGNRIAAGVLFDNNRTPRLGINAEFLKRNIGGSFINWGLGYKSYANAFNSNRNEEKQYYIRFEKPLVSQYLTWLGGLDAGLYKTSNAYLTDSLYNSDFKYSYYSIDAWAAYNFGTKKLRHTGIKSTVRKFLAIRAYHRNFTSAPDKTNQYYDGTYANYAAVLGSFSLFKQNFYRTTYIYGFGRNEDVPVGFSAALISGYSIRRDSQYNQLITRPYFGIEAQRSKYNQKGYYSFYTFRLGGHRYKGGWQDVDLLLNIDHFTRLKPIATNWYRRFFISGGFTRQFSPVLEQALQLKSNFGLPYFDFGYIPADMRTTLKTEAVFYHSKKWWGFGFAPFAFADMCLLKPTRQSFSKSEMYTAVGGGFRIRNEALIFGTIEARFSYYPHLLPGINHFKIKFNTNLRYKYNNSFYRKPDFVAPNS
ncbi:MAG: hypothetical protein RL172_987 [Bacteroidota bacterium]